MTQKYKCYARHDKNINYEKASEKVTQLMAHYNASDVANNNSKNIT